MKGRAKNGSPPLKALSDEGLTALLAQRVMNWTLGPDRYLMNGRRWLPRWRFQPTKSIAHAFQLLEASHVVDYVLRADRNGVYWVKVHANGANAEASGSSLPLTICFAIARVYGIRMEAAK